MHLSYFRLMIIIILFLFSSITLADGLHEAIFKCCRKGEELHSNGRDCVQRPEHEIEIIGDEEDEVVGFPAELKPQRVYWLPLSVLNKLPDRRIFVKYGNRNICLTENFLLINTNDTHRYTITDYYTLNASFTYIDGDMFNVEFETSKYCLDSISGSRGPHVLRLCGPTSESNYTLIRKCCNFGQHIQLKNYMATCQDSENGTWSIHDSTFRRDLPTDIITDVLDNSKSLCGIGEFKIFMQNDASKYFEEGFEENFYLFDKLLYTCFDNFSDEVSENETIGYCYYTSKSAIAYYLVFRHFNVCVVLMLVLGLIILGSRSDISKTVHGKALLCHISSLCFGHILHAVWEYNIQECENTTLIVLNFFMLSSTLWLNAICFNMATGLGAPLDACKHRNRWRVFAWYNLYAWGCSLVHTVLLATKPWKKHSDRNSRSYLYHTKTCVYPFDWMNSNNLDVIFFYYGPTSIILIINVCFLTSSVLKIRKMQRNTSILQRRLSVNIINKHKTSLKYVRLLLTTGVVETVVEMAGLWGRLPTAYNPDGSRLMDEQIWFQRMVQSENSFRILAAVCDLLRALSVLVLSCSTGNTLSRIWKGWRTIWDHIAFARCRKQISDTEVQLNVYTIN